jgi:hypothetical protein
VASKGQVETQLNPLDAVEKKVLTNIFRYILATYAIGNQVKAENFAWYRIQGTTSSNANTEFSVVHGMDHIPSKLIPTMDLSVVNSQMVPLVVSRVPDATRVYLKSSSTGAVFEAYLE